jgi:formate dehydrogenase iron-sulfur subunit
MARMARYALEFCAIESCGKCTPCRIGSTRGVETMDRIIAARGGEERENHARESAMSLLEELCETLAAGSLCGLGGMTPFPVRSAIRHFREDFSREMSGVHARNSNALVTASAVGKE